MRITKPPQPPSEPPNANQTTMRELPDTLDDVDLSSIRLGSKLKLDNMLKEVERFSDDKGNSNLVTTIKN